MSPAKNRHGILQGKIEATLRALSPSGEVFPECAVNTSDNVKVADVVWVSPQRYQVIRDEDVCSIAPEICVEVKSESNTMEEMMIKKDLYLEKDAREFWLCDESGNMIFFDKTGKINGSVLVPKFPARIEL